VEIVLESLARVCRSPLCVFADWRDSSACTSVVSVRWCFVRISPVLRVFTHTFDSVLHRGGCALRR